jgi:NhaP-type Na+/H+ or K+/H+ antiporter
MAVLKGLLLATANVFVVAIGLGIPVLVIMFGGIPGVLAGILIGWLAGQLPTWAPRWRVPLLAVPAFVVVLALAATFGMTAAVPVACIPTLVAALILERWTRRPEPAPVPVATVRSMPE